MKADASTINFYYVFYLGSNFECQLHGQTSRISFCDPSSWKQRSRGSRVYTWCQTLQGMSCSWHDFTNSKVTKFNLFSFLEIRTHWSCRHSKAPHGFRISCTYHVLACNRSAHDRYSHSFTKILIHGQNTYSRVRNRRRAGNKRRAWKIWQKE